MRAIDSNLLVYSVVCLFGVSGCGSSTPADLGGPDMSTPGATVISFDTAAALQTPDHFFDFPFPSDSRSDDKGAPDLRGFPNPRSFGSVEQLRSSAAKRTGYPVIPVGYFKLSAAIPAQDPTRVISAKVESPILLVDLDPGTARAERLIPTVAATFESDGYAPDNLLGAAPYPGFVLHGKRRYAFVVLTSFRDAAGQPIGVAPSLAALVGDTTSRLGKLYAPLWTVLKDLGVGATQVAGAAVFTTGDVVAETAAITDGLKAKYTAKVTRLALAPAGETYDRFCYLQGTISQPQFQVGTPPYNKGGEFDFSDVEGNLALPMKQRDEDVPFAITVPKTAMPLGGYPLDVYFHGSGGTSDQVVQRGQIHTPDGPPDHGKGPAYVVAAYGIGTASAALPLNPERLPGASDFAYININNLSAFRDVFRQGVIEQRLFIEALRTMTIDPLVLGACVGPTLPVGETSYHFSADGLVAQGQSMGGMYTNMVSAVEPRIRAAVPTGAGGYWSYMMLVTRALANAKQLVGIMLGTDAKLSFLHPGVHLLQMAWEPADPYVYAGRLARDPLPGAPARAIYEPVGKNDEYFPTDLYDAVAAAYGHQEVGDKVWPTMQDSLTLQGLGGVLPYPVKQNRMSTNGKAYTGVVVQYAGDGVVDPHYIFQQLDAVKFQYGCFLSSFLKTGVATVPAPAPLGSACP